MKKGIEWLVEMPARHQVLFLKRLSETMAADTGDVGVTNGIWSIADYLNKEQESLYYFIVNSFLWELTPEGHQYWHKMANRAAELE